MSGRNGLLAYRGKDSCESMDCTRRTVEKDGQSSRCYGWHCGNCHEPCSPQGHQCHSQATDQNGEQDV